MLIHLLLLFSLVFSSSGELQSSNSKPDFTGSWNARIVTDPNAPIQQLKISYNDPRLEITRTLIERTSRELKTRGSRNFVFYTDGRGEIQKPVVPNASSDSVQTKTQRVGEKFVTTASSTTKNSDKEVTSDQIVTFEVSPDGARLTETLASVQEGNTFSTIRLYDRVSGNGKDINGEWNLRQSNQLISLTVEHHDPEIKVARRVVTEAQDKTEKFIYYTDGRGETNDRNGLPTKSVTKWKGMNVSFSSSSKSKGDGITINTNESTKWTISEDGQSLIEITETKVSLDQGYMSPPKPTKLIYARSSSPLPK